MSASETIRAARRLFPGAAESVYLNAAGISLVAQPVCDAINGFLATSTSDPLEAHHGAAHDSARAAAAWLIGARADQIALVSSTSLGLNIIADSIQLTRGDNIVTADLEFISTIAPFQQRCREVGAQLRPVSGYDGRVPAERVVEQLDSHTRAVVLSSVVWTNGFRVHLPTIGSECKRLGIPLIVDVIQEVGALPFDVGDARVDVAVCGGHKWIGSPTGLGFLFASDEFSSRFEPRLPYAPTSRRPENEEWLGLWHDAEFSPLREYPAPDGALRFEIGCHHAALGAVGLAAAIDVLRSIGKQAIYEHIMALGDHLARELRSLGLEVVTELGRDVRSGIVTFRTGRSSRDDVEMCELLRTKGIVTEVRYTRGSGGLRACCHVYNDETDVAALVTAVGESIGAGAATR